MTYPGGSPNAQQAQQVYQGAVPTQTYRPQAVGPGAARPTRDNLFLILNSGKLWLDMDSIESISFEETGTFFAKVLTKMGETHWVSETQEEIAEIFQSISEQLA